MSESHEFARDEKVWASFAAAALPVKMGYQGLTTARQEAEAAAEVADALLTELRKRRISGIQK